MTALQYKLIDKLLPSARLSDKVTSVHNMFPRITFRNPIIWFAILWWILITIMVVWYMDPLVHTGATTSTEITDQLRDKVEYLQRELKAVQEEKSYLENKLLTGRTNDKEALVPIVKIQSHICHKGSRVKEHPWHSVYNWPLSSQLGICKLTTHSSMGISDTSNITHCISMMMPSSEFSFTGIHAAYSFLTVRGVYSVPSWADWNHWKYSPGAEVYPSPFLTF